MNSSLKSQPVSMQRTCDDCWAVYCTILLLLELHDHAWMYIHRTSLRSDGRDKLSIVIHYCVTSVLIIKTPFSFSGILKWLSSSNLCSILEQCKIEFYRRCCSQWAIDEVNYTKRRYNKTILMMQWQIILIMPPPVGMATMVRWVWSLLWGRLGPSW